MTFLIGAWSTGASTDARTSVVMEVHEGSVHRVKELETRRDPSSIGDVFLLPIFSRPAQHERRGGQPDFPELLSSNFFRRFPP